MSVPRTVLTGQLYSPHKVIDGVPAYVVVGGVRQARPSTDFLINSTNETVLGMEITRVCNESANYSSGTENFRCVAKADSEGRAINQSMWVDAERWTSTHQPRDAPAPLLCFNVHNMEDHCPDLSTVLLENKARIMSVKPGSPASGGVSSYGPDDVRAPNVTLTLTCVDGSSVDSTQPGVAEITCDSKTWRPVPPEGEVVEICRNVSNSSPNGSSSPDDVACVNETVFQHPLANNLTAFALLPPLKCAPLPPPTPLSASRFWGWMTTTTTSML